MGSTNQEWALGGLSPATPPDSACRGVGSTGPLSWPWPRGPGDGPRTGDSQIDALCLPGKHPVFIKACHHLKCLHDSLKINLGPFDSQIIEPRQPRPPAGPRKGLPSSAASLRLSCLRLPRAWPGTCLLLGASTSLGPDFLDEPCLPISQALLSCSGFSHPRFSSSPWGPVARTWPGFSECLCHRGSL